MLIIIIGYLKIVQKKETPSLLLSSNNGLYGLNENFYEPFTGSKSYKSPGYYNSYTPAERLYAQAEYETKRLAEAIHFNETRNPLLARRIQFDLSDSNMGKCQFIIPCSGPLPFARGDGGFSDPWGTMYLYDGVNGLVLSAGPNKVFHHESLSNERDDVTASFKPVLYVEDVLLREKNRTILLVFNKELKKMKMEPDTFATMKYVKDKATILVRKVQWLNKDRKGIITLYLAQTLELDKEIFLEIFTPQKIVTLTGEQYCYGNGVKVRFRDITYKFISGFQRKKT